MFGEDWSARSRTVGNKGFGFANCKSTSPYCRTPLPCKVTYDETWVPRLAKSAVGYYLAITPQKSLKSKHTIWPVDRLNKPIASLMWFALFSINCSSILSVDCVTKQCSVWPGRLDIRACWYHMANACESEHVAFSSPCALQTKSCFGSRCESHCDSQRIYLVRSSIKLWPAQVVQNISRRFWTASRSPFLNEKIFF